MKNKINILIVLSIILGITIGSCTKREFDTPEVPNPCFSDPGLKVNVTIGDIQKLYNENKLDTVILYGVYTFPKDSNYVLEATVISSDEQGNFYKELYIQDSTGTMKFSIDKKEIFKEFDQGQKVQIKLTGVNISKDSWRAIYILGMGTFNESSIGRMPDDSVSKYIFRKSCPNTQNLDVDTVSISSIYDAEVGKLVYINDVEFIADDIVKTFYDKNVSQGEQPGNKTLRNCANAQLLVRTSEFATFASDTIPSGKGSIMGVVGKYGSDYQLYIVKKQDIMLNKARCN